MMMRHAIPVLVFAGLGGSALAQPLTGSGAHLPLSTPIQVPQPGVAHTLSNIVHPTSFDGTWSAPVQWGWQGTFTAFGPVPNNTNLGSTRYIFSTLNAGLLPAGTFFNFGDVDGGSGGGETFFLRAFDSGGNAITTPWLSVPQYVWGFGRNAGNPDLLDMPGWVFDVPTGSYLIDGNTVSGFNPTVSFTLVSLTGIHTLLVEKGSTFNSFSLAAPIVPSPAGAALMGLGGAMIARRRR
ncbi:MAG: hypothetical protein KJZ65_13110 [Phycisphaerales bacterium]|nr:hypothetical protein [Phycisphaerales bacterium]